MYPHEGSHALPLCREAISTQAVKPAHSTSTTPTSEIPPGRGEAGKPNCSDTGPTKPLTLTLDKELTSLVPITGEGALAYLFILLYLQTKLLLGAPFSTRQSAVS